MLSMQHPVNGPPGDPEQLVARACGAEGGSDARRVTGLSGAWAEVTWWRWWAEMRISVVVWFMWPIVG